MIRRRAIGLGVAAVALSMLLARSWIGAPPARVAWEELRPGVHVVAPASDAPVPVVVILHGCGGNRPFLKDYADAAVEAGVAAVRLDSYAPRGVGRGFGLAAVCTGLRLRGETRVADLAVLLANLRHPRLDMDRVALAGWSHGAWTVAEALAADPPPPVAGAFLVYPYCRWPAGWPETPFAAEAPVLAVVPERDHVGDARACREALDRPGVEIAVVPGATHAFDEPDPAGIGFEHDPEAAAENRARFQAFLRRTLFPAD